MKSYLETITCKNIENHIVRVAEATYHWLCYINNSSDTNILAESSIRYPFVECLERLGYDNIHLEAFHPELKKRRMDVFCGDVDIASNVGVINDKLKFYAEFKFVKSHTRDKPEQQRIFNDIMRLYALKAKFEKAHCYFIICGDTITFNNCFMYIKDAPKTKSTIMERPIGTNADCTPTGIYADLFPFPGEDNPKDFPVIDDLYNCFCAVYEYNNIKNNSKIKTKLISFFTNEQYYQSPQTLAVWEVL